MFWRMLWRKKKTAHRPKKLTQREIISHIEQLSQGESVSYRLPESYGGQVAMVEFNTEYPWRRDGKYLLNVQTLVDGKPTGRKEQALESDEAKEIAAWLSERRGKLLSLAEN